MSKKLEALSPFSGEEGFVLRGMRFETSEARANLLLKAGLVKEIADDTPVPVKEKPQAQIIGKPGPAEDRKTKPAKGPSETK
ncbi:hypothetical protein [Hymenobacter sp. BT491]|uniref:hypothetical protein n=1 Tax=Hymenobacter sp. BT491 TaxID=2766779 RepID=UPI001653655E|nr:hypothetical protein [Hymenobacter sp. BT491]MBC6988939.1 hypothetical protein [Hymenobacter sp. BT491]